MILNIDGKNLVFGMRWKVLVSGGTANKDARASKSSFMWHADKAIYFGLLGEKEGKEKLKQPLFSGAVALAHMYHENPNILLVLPLPDEEGYVVCGIRQGRPRSGFDVIVEDELEVNRLVNEFSAICEQDSFVLLGQAHIDGISPLTFEEIASTCDTFSQLKKVSGIPFNPLMLLALMVAVGLVWGGGNAYVKHRKLEQQRRALAAKKTAQQLYSESIEAKRGESALIASNLAPVSDWVRALPLWLGGWKLTTITCKTATDKTMKCDLNFARGKNPDATNQTFINTAGNLFDSVEFVDGARTIHATTSIKGLAFSNLGAAFDSSKKQRDEVLEFGSTLQFLSRFGEQQLQKSMPFGVPVGVNVAELSQAPIMSSAWEFNGPLRALELTSQFPKYVSVNQIVIVIKDAPDFQSTHSMVAIKVSGAVFSKEI
ncbi:MAG: type 4b pilus protein PilO2 [bacterium]|nr:type 4b pilus protein PilO2 [bacterium]